MQIKINYTPVDINIKSWLNGLITFENNWVRSTRIIIETLKRNIIILDLIALYFFDLCLKHKRPIIDFWTTEL